MTDVSVGQVLAWTSMETPVGPLTLVVGPAGLAAVSFSAGQGAAERLVRPVAGRLGVPVRLAHSPAGCAGWARQFEEYFAGDRRVFDLPLDWSLTDGFGRTVLRTLHATVHYGQVVTYQALAARAGRPQAARVVGAVMGSNPLPVVVPCHRVVASDGLGGFGPGLDAKRWLLALEGVLPATLDFA